MWYVALVRALNDEAGAADESLDPVHLKATVVALREALNQARQNRDNDIAASRSAADAEIAQLSKQLETLQTEKSSQIPLEAMFREISTQFPQALRLSVSTGWASEPLAKSQDASSGELTTTTDIPKRTSLVVQLDLPQALSEDEQRRMRQGWRVRAGLNNVQDVQLLLKVVAPVKSKRRK